LADRIRAGILASLAAERGDGNGWRIVLRNVFD